GGHRHAAARWCPGYARPRLRKPRWRYRPAARSPHNCARLRGHSRGDSPRLYDRSDSWGNSYQRLVLRLWVWTCAPLAMGATTLPMSSPYLITVSPTARSLSAILWPMGAACFAVM